MKTMIGAALAAFLLGGAAADAAEPAPAWLKPAAGLSVSVYSSAVPGAREMALGTKGTLFVGSRREGKVYAVTDGGAKVRVIAGDLQMPVGVAFKDGDLYVSAVSRIVKLPDIENHLDDPPKPVVVTDRLPSETHHGWRYIAFGPDGKLYVPVGAPCNICDQPGYAKLMRMDADGNHWEDIAFGIRNTVGFDWQPGTGKLWFTDNGRDLLGDDLPSDELNRLDRPGSHFGYPYCHQGDTPDPDFGKDKACKDYVPPQAKLGPHVAAIGMHFYEGTLLPAKYRGAAFIAEHGSWNRSSKIGYRVVAATMDRKGRLLEVQPVLDGFLDGDTVHGRPAAVLPLPDGSLLISDDHAGALYRLAAAP